MDRCPVCGARVDPLNPPFTSSFDGETYNFCCEECKEEFDLNPEQYTETAGVGSGYMA
jgi:YHS domain-containing protein